MRARLLCRTGRLKAKDFEITGKLTIGRSPDNSVVLPSRLISGEHARIVFDGNEEAYYLEDLGSLNGTSLDGIPVSGRQRLDRLHVITFGGSFDFIWQGIELCADLEPLGRRSQDPSLATAVDELPPSLGDLDGALAREVASEGTLSDADALPLPAILGGPEAPSRTPVPAQEPVPEGTQADPEAIPLPPGLAESSPEPGTEDLDPGGFVLLVTHDRRVHRVQQRTGENLVGRLEGAEVFIDSKDISRRHAVLTVSGRGVRLRDEGSRNRTFLAGEEVESEVEVKPGSQIRFGVVEAILVLRD